MIPQRLACALLIRQKAWQLLPAATAGAAAAEEAEAVDNEEKQTKTIGPEHRTLGSRAAWRVVWWFWRSECHLEGQFRRTKRQEVRQSVCFERAAG